MIGQTISHYRITGQLGSGGMGVVYEAQDLDLGRRVALKFLPPQLSRDQNALDRFLLEARTASALNHPNICTIYAVEKVQLENADQQSFIAMELLEGETLDHRLAAGAMPLDRLLDWGIQLGGCARRRPRQRNHPSRHQAGKHIYHPARASEGARLRPGQAGAS